MTLSESNFKWRRIFSYALSAAILGLLTYIVSQLDDASALERVAIWLIGLLALVITYYMVAPTAENIVQAIKAAKPFGDDDDEHKAR